MRDLTVRSKADEEQMRSEMKYSLLYESLRDPFVRTNMDGRIVECNDHYCQLVGYSRSELMTMTYVNLTPVRWHAMEAAIAEEQIFQRGFSDVYEKEYRRKDGVVIPVELRTILERSADGRPECMWAIVRDITERHRTEEVLRDSRRSLEAALEVANMAAWGWDERRHVKLWTPQTKAIFGLPPETEMTRELFISMLHPEDVPRYHQAWAAASDPHGSRIYELEYRIRRADGGAERWISSRASVDFDEERAVRFMGAMRDITEEKRAEAAIRESEERFRLLFEQSPDGIFIADATGHFIDVNAAGCDLLGYTRDEALYLTLTDILSADEKARLSSQLESLASGAATNREWRFRRKDGSVFIGELTGRQLPGGRFQGILRDISERKQHEEHVHLLMREVNHRAKNMLGLIIAMARQSAPSEAGDFLGRFEHRIHAMAANQDLLVKNDWIAVPLHELVRSQLEHLGDMRGERFSISGPEIRVSASASQPIGMALHELATNALKHGALSNDVGRVEISWSLGPGDIHASHFTMNWDEKGGPPVAKPVRMGFGSTVIDRMMKSGLGCDTVVEFASSGFQWRIDCPADRVLEEGMGTSFALSGGLKENSVASVSRKRVLVVEDEVLIALELDVALSDAGFDVIGPAGSVAEALALIENTSCDVATLDFNLGGETSEAIATLLRARNTPFVLMSGYSREQLPTALFDAPLLAKPLRSEHLIAEIERCLASQSAPT